MSEYGQPDKPETAKSTNVGQEGEKGSSQQWSDFYSYDKDGTLIYTDPATKQQFVLNKDQTDWVPKDGSQVQGQPYKFDGKTYEYVNEQGVKFKWDISASQWRKAEEKENGKDKGDDDDEVEEEESEEDENTTEEDRKRRQYRKRKAQPGWGKQGTYYTDENTGAQLYKDPNDGMVYEWDRNKNAWFPKIDEDFMAQYQLNYGFTKDGEIQPTRPEEPKEEDSVAEKKAKETKKKDVKKPEWFEEDESRTTKVYVSNLPLDITETKFVEFMSKCGMIEIDVRTNKPKVKIYKDDDGFIKGDALCTYIKVESVQLALQILDGSVLNGRVVKVERAKFQMKGQKYNPKLKPRKLQKKELELLKKKHEKLFAWQPEKLRGQRSKRDRIIVIKNLFDPAEFDKDAGKIIDITKDLRERCGKFGKVGKVVLYDKNPEGVAQVFFSSPTEADMAIEMMNGRLFTGRQLNVATWDGKTKYKMTETEEEEKERLAKWDKFLEGEESEEEKEEASEKKKVQSDERTS